MSRITPPVELNENIQYSPRSIMCSLRTSVSVSIEHRMLPERLMWPLRCVNVQPLDILTEWVDHLIVIRTANLQHKINLRCDDVILRDHALPHITRYTPRL
jgi:hypothetical protein